MKDEVFEKVKSKIKSDLSINESNVLLKTIEIPKLFIRYSELFVKQMEHYKLLLLSKDKLYGELYEKYKYKGQYNLSTKGEVEAFVYSDEEWISLNKECIKQECITKFLENVLSDVKQLSFNLKNFIEYKKYLEGVV